MQSLPGSEIPVLLVDDEPRLLRPACLLLRSAGITSVLTEQDGRKVLPLLNSKDVGVVLLDLAMPHVDGQQLLTQITAKWPDLSVIVMTGNNELETAVACMREGALDYLVKPVEESRLLVAVKRALELRHLRNENEALKRHLLNEELVRPAAFSAIVTKDRQMLGIFRYLEAIAGSRQPVLVCGETGTGKELVARAVHELSGLSGEYVSVNAAGVDDNVFSDTLFGHKKGAFTDAREDRLGLVAKAAGGTLFLDEIGDLKPESQVKLLRLLQNGEYYPLGTDKQHRSQARLVLATNQNMADLAETGTMRKDLYYRLRTHHAQLPPLRERKVDLPLLVEKFLVEAATELNKKVPTSPPALIQLLSSYHFPGNIRELESMVFDAVARHQGGLLSMQSFKDSMGNERPRTTTPIQEARPVVHHLNALFPGRLPTLKEAENYLVTEALRRADGNQGIAASMLGFTRTALNKRLKRSEQRNGD